jgi:hypothetical protein
MNESESAKSHKSLAQVLAEHGLNTAPLGDDFVNVEDFVIEISYQKYPEPSRDYESYEWKLWACKRGSWQARCHHDTERLISVGKLAAFDADGFTTTAPTSKTSIRRTDAVAYAANIGVVFAEKPPIDTAPEQEAATPAPVALSGIVQDSETIRYEVLASRTELIDAFSLYGVELKIFKALKDRPGLQAACRVKGQGQKGGCAEPMFCPKGVIDWLVKSGVKDKPKLTAYMGWHILETKFANVYAEHSIGDPRQT